MSVRKDLLESMGLKDEKKWTLSCLIKEQETRLLTNNIQMNKSKIPDITGVHDNTLNVKQAQLVTDNIWASIMSAPNESTEGASED